MPRRIAPRGRCRPPAPPGRSRRRGRNAVAIGCCTRRAAPVLLRNVAAAAAAASRLSLRGSGAPLRRGRYGENRGRGLGLSLLGFVRGRAEVQASETHTGGFYLVVAVIPSKLRVCARTREKRRPIGGGKVKQEQVTRPTRGGGGGRTAERERRRLQLVPLRMYVRIKCMDVCCCSCRVVALLVGLAPGGCYRGTCLASEDESGRYLYGQGGAAAQVPYGRRTAAKLRRRKYKAGTAVKLVPHTKHQKLFKIAHKSLQRGVLRASYHLRGVHSSTEKPYTCKRMKQGPAPTPTGRAEH